MPYLTPVPGSPAPTETAVIAPVLAANSLVGDFRDRLDAAAGWGVPAHVTVLYPFVERTALDERVVATLEAAVALIAGTHAPNSWRILCELPLGDTGNVASRPTP